MPGSFKRLVRNLRREAELTAAERDMLLHALHLHDVLHGAGLLTGRTMRLATARKLVDKNFAREQKLVVVDGDGWRVEPERWRDGFVLTPAGMAVARRIKEQAK